MCFYPIGHPPGSDITIDGNPARRLQDLRTPLWRVVGMDRAHFMKPLCHRFTGKVSDDSPDRGGNNIAQGSPGSYPDAKAAALLQGKLPITACTPQYSP
jgi:hypothetical protein